MHVAYIGILTLIELKKDFYTVVILEESFINLLHYDLTCLAACQGWCYISFSYGH